MFSIRKSVCRNNVPRFFTAGFNHGLFRIVYFRLCLSFHRFLGLMKVTPKYGEIIFNFLFALITFASILGPIGYLWPLDADQDLITYFPMYAMTLHFFPIVVWFTLKPLFIKK